MRGYRVNFNQTYLHLSEKVRENLCRLPNFFPEAAFFSSEEKVQLLSGKYPRNLTKERLKGWLSYRKGTAKHGSARSEDTKAELPRMYKLCNVFCHVLKPSGGHKCAYPTDIELSSNRVNFLLFPSVFPNFPAAISARILFPIFKIICECVRPLSYRDVLPLPR